MGIISRYFMTEINLETTKSLSKCAAEWATNLITFGRLMSQGPGNLRGLQTNAQTTQCTSENGILIDFTCAKICGSWGERGCRDLFCVTTLEKTAKKAWLVQSPIPNPGLRSGCKWRTFQVLVTVMAPDSPAWCSEELLPLCEISLQEISVPCWLTPGLGLSLLPALVGIRGSQFLGGLLFQQSDSQREGYRHLCTLFPLLSDWLHENDFLKYVAFKINLSSLLNWENALAYEMSL